MKEKLIIGLFLTFFTYSLYAVKSDTTFLNANKIYDSANYTQAAETYQKMIVSGAVSAELYYNLANAYYKTKDYPLAILWYERALLIAPSDEDIQYNLEITNHQLVDKFEPIPRLFIWNWIDSVVNFFTSDLWAIIAIASFVLSICFLLLYLLMRSLTIRRIGFWMGILFLVFTIKSITFSYLQLKNMQAKNEAIIISPVVTAKSSPDSQSTDLFVIHEGIKVKIRQKIGVWNEIILPNGDKGWLPIESMEVI